MDNKTIKLRRSHEVFRSQREAMAWIATTPHAPGQPVAARYWASETETDVILALGTASGIGPGHYSVISASTIKVVSGLIHSEAELPDVSMLVNGETWLYEEPVTRDLYWIYLNEDIRDVQPVDPGINYRVFVLSENAEYWMYGGELERANNYYSRATMDQRLADLEALVLGEISETSESIGTRLTGISNSLGLAPGETYPGTISGATTFAEADSILASRISQTATALGSVTNRVTDIEKELTTGSDQITGRLDEVASWMDTETHRPTAAVTLSLENPGNPVISGSIVKVLASYRWSWADRGGWNGLILEGNLKPFGINGVDPDATPSGSYDWIYEVMMPESGASVTLSASFGGPDGAPGDTITLTPAPTKKNIVIEWPTDQWSPLTGLLRYNYQVFFEGTGLPASEAGNEMSVTQSGTRVFQAVQTSEPNQLASYIGNLTPSTPGTPVVATWNASTETTEFWPVFMVKLGKGQDVITENLEASACRWTTYCQDWKTEIPEFEWLPGQTVVLLGHESFPGDIRIEATAPRSEPIVVTSEFTLSGLIEFLGSPYHYIAFPEIGAGTFGFKIT